MLHFQYPEYLWALALLPVFILCFVHVIRWKKKSAKKIGDPELVQTLIQEYSPRKFTTKYLLLVISFILCTVAVAALVIPDKTQRITRNGTDLMIVLDVSKSMLATDIKPDRLERARQLISKVIEQMPNERIGLVIFAGRAYLQMPLTIDHQAAKMFISAITTDDVPTQGTVISGALRMAQAAFNPNDKSYKSVLLISDGEDHDKEAEKAANELAKDGIMVNTIGIGSPEGALIPDEITGQYKKDREGNTVISKLNEAGLRKIADITHGTYQLYSNPDEIISRLKKQLAQIEMGSILSDSSYLSFHQFYSYFLIAAFILLIIEMLLSEKKRRALRSAFSLLFVLGFIQPVYAQSTNETIRDGNKFYQERKFDQAEKEYRRALEDSKNNDIAGYNMGNVQYRQNRLEEAVKYYDQTIQTTSNIQTRQNAYYNKGVALQTAEKLPECITAYKNALLLNPDDEAARQNLQRALQKQKEQQQQQQQENQQKKKQKEDQKPQNKEQPQQSPPSITKKDAEEKLKALAAKERELQDRLRKVKGTSAEQPDKDW